MGFVFNFLLREVSCKLLFFMAYIFFYMGNLEIFFLFRCFVDVGFLEFV